MTTRQEIIDIFSQKPASVEFADTLSKDRPRMLGMTPGAVIELLGPADNLDVVSMTCTMASDARGIAGRNGVLMALMVCTVLKEWQGGYNWMVHAMNMLAKSSKVEGKANAIYQGARVELYVNKQKSTTVLRIRPKKAGQTKDGTV